jgi:hypothetical protein
MHFLTKHSHFRVVSVSVASLLCVLMIAIVAQKSSSNELLKKKPSVVLQASTSRITLPCQPGSRSVSGACPATANTTVGLVAIAKDFHGQPLYAYTTSGGRITGEGSNVTWDLSGVGPGTYIASVEVRDDKRHRVASSIMVAIVNCDCIPDVACASISVNCPDKVKDGVNASFTANLSEVTDVITYNWTISEGEIISGQRTSTIIVRTKNLHGKSITATLEIGGQDPGCARTSSCSMEVTP